MPDLDANSLGQDLLKINLITEAQLEEALDGIGGKGAEAERLVLFLERKGYITPWQSSKIVKGDRDGFILGGYRLLYKIQSGSFGRVFRAQEEATGQVVAVKVLRRRWSEDQAHIDLFQREARVGMAFHHPNIVEILTVGVDKNAGQYYIVMEFVEGCNLREMLAIRTKLEPLEAIKVIEDAANGLAYAFSRGFTHRDMKLTNILVSSSGTAKLVDFGLAKMFQAMTGSSEDKVDRTVDYAGLERKTNVPTGDIRSDIYFLGCVLYEILLGRPPLDMTRDKQARMNPHRFDGVKPLGRDEVQGPPSLFRLVETMMELSPSQRYQTPAQLLEAIRSVRRELEGRASGQAQSGPRGVFVVESDPRLQDHIRDKLKELGYRVFIAGDPARAYDRFRQQPYDGLVVDARTTGEEGLLYFDRISTEADRQGISCGAILILSHEQADWAVRVKQRPSVLILTDPPQHSVTMRQLIKGVQTLVPLADNGAAR
ncbi:MAG TPA: protein kinase [Gemmataceae bacterium]|nr:protein kinase [Gemmataceae bacterium]